MYYRAIPQPAGRTPGGKLVTHPPAKLLSEWMESDGNCYTNCYTLTQADYFPNVALESNQAERIVNDFASVL